MSMTIEKSVELEKKAQAALDSCTEYATFYNDLMIDCIDSRVDGASGAASSNGDGLVPVCAESDEPSPDEIRAIFAEMDRDYYKNKALLTQDKLDAACVEVARLRSIMAGDGLDDGGEADGVADIAMADDDDAEGDDDDDHASDDDDSADDDTVHGDDDAPAPMPGLVVESHYERQHIQVTRAWFAVRRMKFQEPCDRMVSQWVKKVTLGTMRDRVYACVRLMHEWPRCARHVMDKLVRSRTIASRDKKYAKERFARSLMQPRPRLRPQAVVDLAPPPLPQPCVIVLPDAPRAADGRPVMVVLVQTTPAAPSSPPVCRVLFGPEEFEHVE